MIIDKQFHTFQNLEHEMPDVSNAELSEMCPGTEDGKASLLVSTVMWI